MSTTLTMGSGAFAPGSVRVTDPIGREYHSLDGANEPDARTEDEAYATMMRVRDWDANVRAGWMPIANGRKRMIPPDPEYDAN